MAKPTRGLYLARGRGLELEKMIADVRAELLERVAAAEARAGAAEERANALVETLTRALVKPKPKETS